METTAPKTFRAFIAIDLSMALQQDIHKLIQALKKQQAKQIKWINENNLHLTLKFLDNISNEQSQQITPMLAKIAKNHSSFAVQFDQIIGFPSLKKPRVLALKPNPIEQLTALALAIEQEVTKCNIPIEKRPYIPHLTIGRIRDHLIKPIAIEHIILPQTKLEVTEIILYRSDLSTTGATYTKIASFALQ